MKGARDGTARVAGGRDQDGERTRGIAAQAHEARREETRPEVLERRGRAVKEFENAQAGAIAEAEQGCGEIEGLAANCSQLDRQRIELPPAVDRVRLPGLAAPLSAVRREFSSRSRPWRIRRLARAASFP